MRLLEVGAGQGERALALVPRIPGCLRRCHPRPELPICTIGLLNSILINLNAQLDPTHQLSILVALKIKLTIFHAS